MNNFEFNPVNSHSKIFLEFTTVRLLLSLWVVKWNPTRIQPRTRPNVAFQMPVLSQALELSRQTRPISYSDTNKILLGLHENRTQPMRWITLISHHKLLSYCIQIYWIICNFKTNWVRAGGVGLGTPKLNPLPIPPSHNQTRPQ